MDWAAIMKIPGSSVSTQPTITPILTSTTVNHHQNLKRKVQNVLNISTPNQQACPIVAPEEKQPIKKRNLGRNERKSHGSGSSSDIPSHILSQIPNSDDPVAMAAWLEERKKRFPRLHRPSAPAATQKTEKAGFSLGYSDSDSESDDSSPPDELPIRKNIFSLSALTKSTSPDTLADASTSNTTISVVEENLDPSVAVVIPGLQQGISSLMQSFKQTQDDHTVVSTPMVSSFGHQEHSTAPLSQQPIQSTQSNGHSGVRLCRHFLRGHCKQGASCAFSHDEVLRDQAKERHRQRTLSQPLSAGKNSSTAESSLRDILLSKFGANGLVRNPFSNAAFHTSLGRRKKGISLGSAINPPSISLARKLFANDMLKEQSKVLQCFRYIVQNNFFIEDGSQIDVLKTSNEMADEDNDDSNRSNNNNNSNSNNNNPIDDESTADLVSEV